MVNFISYKERFFCLFNQMIPTDEWHLKWLNTLSFLENSGARKIAACEHPTKVKKEMLKHAAEEFRHAFYLKLQMNKISSKSTEDYSALLGGRHTLHYLQALDLKICRYLKKEKKIEGSHLKEIAYLLVTYAIELRANELYSIYHQVLRQKESPITVKSILLEEDQHLADMEAELSHLADGQSYIARACQIESRQCNLWLNAIESELALKYLVL